MSVESALNALGLSELLARDYLAVQLIVLAATALLFVMSLAVMMFAARSAGGARKARSEAETILRHAQDTVVEARQIAAKIERANGRSHSDASASGRPAQPVRVSARETTAEADVEIVDLKRTDAVSSRNLDAAKESASVPKSLLRGRH